MNHTELGDVGKSFDPGILQLLQLLRGQSTHLDLAPSNWVRVSRLVGLMARDGRGSGIGAQILWREATGCRRDILFVGSTGRTARRLMNDTLAEILDGALGRGEHGVVVMVVGGLGGR